MRLAQGYHGIVVKAYAAAYAVVVGRQQVLQEFIVGGKPLDSHVMMSSQVARAVGVGHYHQVVLDNVVAVAVKHKTALAASAQQVHAGAAELGRVHRLKLVGILEKCVHRHKNTQYFQRKKAICAKSENCDVFCETFATLFGCNFAV